jgi:hypothetical protein
MSELTPEFLSTLAARLADRNTAPKDAIRRALELWDEAKQQLEYRKQREAIIATARAKHDGIPRPDRFPISFDELLKRLMPQKSGADRAKAYRDYIRAGGDPNPEKIIEKLKKQTVGEAAYVHLYPLFTEWLEKSLSVSRSRNGKKRNLKQDLNIQKA